MRLMISFILFIAVILGVYYMLPNDKLWLMLFIVPTSFGLIDIIMNLFKRDKQNEIQNEDEMDDSSLPWYLKEDIVFLFCILVPPIGYLVTVSNLKKLEYKQKINYLTIATISTSLWVLKFLPDDIELYVWSFILAIVIGNSLLKFFRKNKKSD